MKSDLWKNKENKDFIPAQHEYWTQIFFNIYMDFMEKSYFHRIQFEKPDDFEESNPKSTLILCNHFSWWDALLVYNWNRKVLRKKFHCMVLLNTLIQNPSLQKVGGYSVNPGNRSVIKSLEYTQVLLKSPGNTVLIFPQGKLLSGHASYIHFEPGLNRILMEPNPEFNIIFMAGFMDHFSEKKPEIQFYLENIKTKNDLLGLEKNYNSFYSQARIKQGKRNA